MDTLIDIKKELPSLDTIESNKYIFATMTDIFNSLMKICDSIN